MALIVCPDCTRQVSPKSRFCVHCGRPRPACKGNSWFRKVMGVLLVAGIAGGGYAATSYWNNNKEFRIRTMATLDSIADEVKALKNKVGGGTPSKAEKLAPSENDKDQKEMDRKRSD